MRTCSNRLLPVLFSVTLAGARALVQPARPVPYRSRKPGAAKILVTHPEWPTYHSCQAQKELAKRGDVFFEGCSVSTTHLCACVPFETIERAIIETGVERTVLSTDLGQPETPPPAEGLRL